MLFDLESALIHVFKRFIGLRFRLSEMMHDESRIDLQRRNQCTFNTASEWTSLNVLIVLFDRDQVFSTTQRVVMELGANTIGWE